jgi:hypothetical protein
VLVVELLVGVVLVGGALDDEDVGVGPSVV